MLTDTSFCDAVIDKESLASLLEDLDPLESRELFSRLVEIYLQETPRKVKALAEALASDLPGEVRLASHSIKSSSAMLGAHKAADVSYQIEQFARMGELAGVSALLAALEQECEQVYACLQSIRDSGFPSEEP
ncbi:hypothetical protein GTO89_14900 [Heliobacterium gestii]|uniref:HPt domain-containing protein n=1 Tax=Heliomicrobium gestii TaxID=2699 RepID=A0A845LFI0_HELGE|nr:Hpt domain-containing protein [Heliomicrobium gestii]MBM7868153.1 HPt (histidine-containing phosphotransfer) domain-containing protein [Heliomicrobium gestii]MZP44321.1 hypothetical protein [Heliomicrobium gestii]